jgi:hypothetical protein
MYLNDNNNDIYEVKWDEIQFILRGDNKRYDIIMPNDSCRVYIANNVAVLARKERKQPGYLYE